MKGLLLLALVGLVALALGLPERDGRRWQPGEALAPLFDAVPSGAAVDEAAEDALPWVAGTVIYRQYVKRWKPGHGRGYLRRGSRGSRRR